MKSYPNANQDFQLLMYEFLPHVSEDYVFAFYITCRLGLFYNIIFLRFLFSFYPYKYYQLCVKFTDGNVFYYSINKNQVEYWKNKLNDINYLLQEKRYQKHNTKIDFNI